MIPRFLLRYAIVLSLLPSLAFSLEPEEVLGEYWKDPLFGEAAAELEVELELLHRLIWPPKFTAELASKVRLVVRNKTEQIHVLAVAESNDGLISDESFRSRISDDLHHAENMPSHSAGHVHGGSSVDAPESLVKTIDQKPSLLIKPGEFKELIMSVDRIADLNVFCVLEGHENLGHQAVMTVVEKP